MSKKIAKNTYVEIEMEDGEVLKLTLTYIALLKMKKRFPEEYSEYNRIMTHGAKDELDSMYVLYAGYLCGLVMQGQEIDEADTYEDFLCRMTPDREYTTQILKKLVNPKKATASEAHS